MKNKSLHRLHTLRVENETVREQMDRDRPAFERLRTRHQDGTAPRAVTGWQLFQTPADLAERMAGLLHFHGYAGQFPSILEPSAGLGRLLDAARARFPFSKITAIEQAPQLAAELFQQDRPGVKLLQRDFMEQSPDQIGRFDFILMNPPFHMRADVRHIQHARQFLRPGGTLAALCMNTRHRVEAFQHEAETWQPLPAGTFSQEGTRIETILFTLRA